MGTLTYDEAISLLEAAVAEKGEDYVYPQHLKRQLGACQYFVDGKPACIVGHVLAARGFKAYDLEPYEGLSVDEMSLSLDTEPDALRALYRAQRMQDAGETWGDALEAAGNIARSPR